MHLAQPKSNTDRSELTAKFLFSPLFWILLLGAVLRIVWAVVTPAVPVSDFAVYDKLAVEMLAGHGYQTGAGPIAYIPPGYPLWLAFVYYFAGHSLLAAKLVNSLLAIFTIYLVYLLAKNIFTQRIALLSALLVALMPSLILYAGLLASENLAIPLFLAAIYFYRRALETKQSRYCIGAGLIMGLTIMVRPITLLVPVVWLVYYLLHKPTLKQFIFHSALLGICTLAPILPWTIRNYLVFQHFIPISTNGSYALLVGFKGTGYTGDYTGFVCQTCQTPGADEYTLSQAVGQEAISFALAHPETVLKLIPVKMFHLFQDDVSGVSWNFANSPNPTPGWVKIPLYAAAQGYYVLLVILALLAIPNRKALAAFSGYGLLLTPIYAMLITHLVVIGIDRYHLPVLPLIAIFAAYSLVQIMSRTPKRGEAEAIFEREISFHDEWAETTPIESIDVCEAFENPLAPENQLARSLMGDLAGKKVLDVGTGLGESAVYFALQGAEVTATDISPKMVQLAQQLAAYHHTSINTLVSTAEKLDLPDNSIDICYSANLLHHVSDPHTALTEMQRVLKPGGLIVSWDPLAYNPLINIYRLMASQVRTKDEAPLTFDILHVYRQIFTHVQHQEFWLTGLLIFVKYYLIDRIHPNQKRYWKQVLKEGPATLRWMTPLIKLDQILLKIPPINYLAWTILIYARKGDSDSSHAKP